MPRITTGLAKGKNLEVPQIPNIRAVQDVAKLAIFSILGEKITNAICLDLYAGSGSLGLEALSRGAASCDFVDEQYKAITTIEKNLKNLKIEAETEVIQSDSIKFAANTHKKYDIIFADPFYNDLKHKFLFQNLEEILDENGAIVFLHGKELDIEEQISNTQLKIFTQRRFGNSHITLLTH